MEIVMANTISGLSRYLDEHPADLIVVHGDRVESLAGATVGALRNILVAHVEGGELSGTVDDLMRHATSKLSHVHFVASEAAERRLIQLGELPETIFNIGSPDIDVMLSESLPLLAEAKQRYDVDFESYAIGMLHPVTTECDFQRKNAKVFIDALLESNYNYIIIYPNNDSGSDKIFDELTRIEGNKKFRTFPSIRFEYFLTFLKNAAYVIGNSSAGIHEAPVYGVPTINIGTRQNNRFRSKSIIDVDFDKSKILDSINHCVKIKRFEENNHYGKGDSSKKFLAVLNDGLWKVSNQKVFRDIINV